MLQQFFEQQVPSVRIYREKNGQAQVDKIPGIDVLEVVPETSARIAKHAGESGKVFADTRVVMPARYRARILIPEQSTPTDVLPAINNLLNASFKSPVKFAVTSFYTRCYDMMVVSSRNRDTNDQTNLREQEVMFEECLKIESVSTENAESSDDAPYETASPQFITKSEQE